MYYTAELNFVLSFCKKYHINTTIFTEKDEDISDFDMKLRQMMGIDFEYDSLRQLLKEGHENCIYRIQDNFQCIYYFLNLPQQEVSTALSIGPFTVQEISAPTLMHYIEQYSMPPHLFKSLQNYFFMVPFIPDDSMLQAILNTLGEKIWGSLEDFSYEFIDHGINTSKYPMGILQNSSPNDYLPYDMHAIESRYVRENEMIQAVIHGHGHKAEALLGSNSTNYLEQRVSDPLRNAKNYAIVLNTLLRKAVEVATVHPYQIDKISSDFARKIEQLPSVEGMHKLMREMTRKYSLLVKNHSMKKYSSLIQNAVKLIETDLTADLGLKSVAQMLNVNPSYLSNQFKKATDMTLTDYVNQKRVEYALLLLNTTSLQIQTIAQYCGIPDVNYFTKIFKKIIGKTPSEYRKSILGK